MTLTRRLWPRRLALGLLALVWAYAGLSLWVGWLLVQPAQRLVGEGSGSRAEACGAGMGRRKAGAVWSSNGR